MRLAIKLFSRASQGLRRDVLGRFEPGIWIITIFSLFTSFSFSICLPFLALYLYQEQGFPMTLIGVVFLIAGLCSAATQIVAGWLSDRFGRRPLLLGATGISMLLYSGIGVLIWVSAPLWAILAVYIAARSVLTTTRPVVPAMIADLSPKGRLTEAYGIMRVGRNVGWAAGPAIGGYLLTFLPYAWLFGAAALICALAFCFALLFIKESFHEAAERVTIRSIFSVVTDRIFLIFTGLCLLASLSMGQLSSTLSVFTVDRLGFSIAQYGLLLTMNGLVIILFQYPVARGLGRLMKSRGLILGCLLYSIGYLSLSWVGSFGWALAAIVIITSGEMVFQPVSLAVVGELAPQDRRGRYMGFFELAEMMGMSAGPLVGGILLDVFPTDPPFIWGTIASGVFVAAVGFYVWGRRTASSIRINANT